MSDGTTHWAGCIQAGPKHYECALQEIGRLRLTITHLRVELEKKEWVGLTDEEVHALPDYLEDRVLYRLIRAAEAKLKEKNNGG
jgi:hypothetical protein